MTFLISPLVFFSGKAVEGDNVPAQFVVNADSSKKAADISHIYVRKAIPSDQLEKIVLAIYHLETNDTGVMLPVKGERHSYIYKK